MATRTEPIRLLLLLVRTAAGATALMVDQVVQPADVPLDRLQPVPLQLGRVLVQPLARPGEGLPDAVQPLLQPAAAPLEDPQPRVGVQPREEREPVSYT